MLILRPNSSYTMVRIFCFLSLLLALSSHAQDSSHSHIITHKANSLDKQYKKILIAGCGQGSTRYFIENLAPQVIEHYQKQGVTCVYEYIGSDQASLKAGITTAINNHQPDATLMMYQFYEKPDTLITKDTRTVGRIVRTTVIGAAPYQQTQKMKRANKRINEEVKLAILEGKNAASVWQGQLNIIDESIKEKLYEKICFLLTEELSKNKIPF